MSDKARITSRFPSEQEVAARLRLSSGRVAELRKQLNDLHTGRPDGANVIDLKKARAEKVVTRRRAEKASAKKR